MSELEKIYFVGGVVLGVANWTFAIAHVVRRRSVKGTRRRYVCATISWTLAPLIATQPFWMVLSGTITWIWIMCAIGNYYLLWELYRDDDDNWWKRKKKKLKTWVQNMQRKPVAIGVKS